MSRLKYILQKEFIQISRNKGMLRIIFILPIIQLFVLVSAATFEVKHIDMAIYDNDQSTSSQKLIARIQHNPLFRLCAVVHSQDEAERLIQKNKIDLALCIPRHFDKQLTTATHPQVQILVDAIVGNSAQLGSSYLGSIIADFNRDIQVKNAANNTAPQIIVNNSFWYNAQLNYKYYMAPGILVVLITIIGMFLGGMNLVREKELGTIEQLNVTPIQKWELLAGKLLPFLIIGLFDLALGLGMAKLAFALPIRGSLLLLFVVSTVYLIMVLSLGLYISTESDTQQQVTFVSYFLLMVFILMSGLFTPVESMPHWAQQVDLLNPLYYFVKIMRSVVLKGAGMRDILNEFLALLAYAIAIFSLAVLRYKKRN